MRLIRAVVDEALDLLSAEFDQLHARIGRPGIAPERLLRALLLQAFYSVRSERQLMEQLDHSLLFRWFVGLAMDAPVWDASTFSKNRDRLLAGDVAQRLLAAVVAQPRVWALMSDEHFSVDGTLIQAWASQKSFQPKPAVAGEDGDGPPTSGGAASDGPALAAPGDGRGSHRPGRNQERDWHGRTRSNETHASTTDPDARLARKPSGQASILAYAPVSFADIPPGDRQKRWHVLMENRSGLVAHACLAHATGTAEREAALILVRRLTRQRQITLGADKGYDAAPFIKALREQRVTPHIAADMPLTKTGKRRRSAIDGRTTRHRGYAVSQRIRKRIEEVFGWIKAAAGLRQTKHRGRHRVGWCFALATAAYNLIRLPKLLAETPA